MRAAANSRAGDSEWAEEVLRFLGEVEAETRTALRLTIACCAALTVVSVLISAALISDELSPPWPTGLGLATLGGLAAAASSSLVAGARLYRGGSLVSAWPRLAVALVGMRLLLGSAAGAFVFVVVKSGLLKPLGQFAAGIQDHPRGPQLFLGAFAFSLLSQRWTRLVPRTFEPAPR
jgi:hypothetical protein